MFHVLEVIRWVALPVTFPLALCTAFHTESDGAHAKSKTAFVHAITKPAELAGRFLLPAEVYLSVAE